MNGTIRKHTLYGVIAILLLFGTDDVWAQPSQKTLTLGISVMLSDTELNNVLNNPDTLPIMRLQAMLQHLGYDLKLEYYPGRRLLTEANNGNIDGILARDMTTPEQYPNLVCSNFYRNVQPALYGLKSYAQTQSHGRTTSCLVAPTQIRTCGITASGSSIISSPV